MARVPNTKSAKRSATRRRSPVVTKTKTATRGAAEPNGEVLSSTTHIAMLSRCSS